MSIDFESLTPEQQTKLKTGISELEEYRRHRQLELNEYYKADIDETELAFQNSLARLHEKIQEEHEFELHKKTSYWTERAPIRGIETVRPLLEAIRSRGYIGGSYAAFAVSRETFPILPNDIDIFAMSDPAAKDIGGELLGMGYHQTHTTDVATTYAPPSSVRALDVQVVRQRPHWTTFPDDILTSFDLNVCRAILIDADHVLCDEEAGTKTGRVLRTHDPLRTLKRMSKYAARGIGFSDHEYLKIFQAWEQMSQEKKQAHIKAATPATILMADSSDMKWDDDDEWLDGE